MNYRIKYILNNMVYTDKSTTGVGNGLHDIGSGPTDRFNDIWAVTFNGVSTSTYYADVAERYSCNPNVEAPIGTIMDLSNGDYEVEVCNVPLSIFVLGVISEKPALIMNEKLEDGLIIGLLGRLPVRVIGIIRKRDVIVSSGNGCARIAVTAEEALFGIGHALEDSDDLGEKLIKCVLKK